MAFLSCYFDPVPNRIHLSKIDIAEPFAVPSQLIFQSIKSRYKFVRGFLQRTFCIYLAFPRQVNDREKDVANLICHVGCAFSGS